MRCGPCACERARMCLSARRDRRSAAARRLRSSVQHQHHHPRAFARTCRLHLFLASARRKRADSYTRGPRKTVRELHTPRAHCSKVRHHSTPKAFVVDSASSATSKGGPCFLLPCASANRAQKECADRATAVAAKQGLLRHRQAQPPSSASLLVRAATPTHIAAGSLASPTSGHSCARISALGQNTRLLGPCCQREGDPAASSASASEWTGG
jgi:hypothetical protein